MKATINKIAKTMLMVIAVVCVAQVCFAKENKNQQLMNEKSNSSEIFLAAKTIACGITASAKDFRNFSVTLSPKQKGIIFSLVF